MSCGGTTCGTRYRCAPCASGRAPKVGAMGDDGHPPTVSRALGLGVGEGRDPGEWLDPLEEWVPLAPELDEEVQEVLRLLPYALAQANIELARVNGPERTILTHFFNDVLLFVAQTANGDGRSAARSARSLFEHLVNYVTVTEDAVEADRYAASRFVTADRLGRLDGWWLALLDGKQKREEGRRLRRMVRHAAVPLAQASARFDAPRRKYANNVFSDNLYRRCQEHGMVDDYDAYRVLSGVVHGDAGGLLGLTQSVGNKGARVHRVGPDLQLVALAWLYGYRWITEFLCVVYERHPLPSVEEAANHAGFLVGRFGSVLRAARRLDARTWPDEPPPQPIAIAAIFRPTSGAIRWYLYDRRLQSVVVADPGPYQESAIDAMRADVTALTYSGPSPAVVECPHIRVYPRRAARYAHVSSALPGQEHWLTPMPKD